MIAVVLMIFTACNISTKTFSDVLPNHWAEKKISALVKDNVITGYPDGTFKPNQPVTKAEFTTMLSRTAKQEIKNKECPRPDANLTRAEAVRLAISAVDAGELTEPVARNYISIYKDAGKIPGWAVIPVAKAQKLYVISPPPSTKKYFNPSKLITRAEAAVLLYNLKEKAPVHTNKNVLFPKTSEGKQLESAGLEENGIIALIPEGTIIEGLYTDEPIKRRKSSLRALFVVTTQTNYVTKQNYLLFPAGTNISGEIATIKPASLNARRIVMNGAEASELNAQIYTDTSRHSEAKPKNLLQKILRCAQDDRKFILNKGDTVYVKLTKPVRVDTAKTTIVIPQP